MVDAGGRPLTLFARIQTWRPSRLQSVPVIVRAAPLIDRDLVRPLPILGAP